jgi:hypothetical protein
MKIQTYYSRVVSNVFTFDQSDLRGLLLERARQSQFWRAVPEGERESVDVEFDTNDGGEITAIVTRKFITPDDAGLSVR